MENEIRLLRYYLDLARRKAIFLIIPAAIVFGIGLMIVMALPRAYEAQARIVAKASGISSTLVESTVTNERMQFIEQRVLARENLLALAQKFNLFSELRGTTSDTDFADLVRQQISVQAMPLDPTDETSDAAVFTIGFEGNSPEQAQAVTSELISMIIEANRTARMSQASEATRFLEREVAELTGQLDVLDDQWTEFIEANETTLPSRLPIYSTELQEQQQELLAIQSADATLAADITFIEAQLAVARERASPERAREVQLQTLRSDLATRLSVLSESHPEIRGLRSQIASLEAVIAADTATQPRADVPVDDLPLEMSLLAGRLVTAEKQRETYAARTAAINERMAWLRQTIAAMPAIETEMDTLQRHREAAQANFVDMTARLNTARLGERLESDQQDGQIQILETADLPQYPSSAGRTRLMLIVGSVALAVGLGILLLVDSLDRTIKSSREFDSVLEGGSLVLLPHWTIGSTGVRKLVLPIALFLMLVLVAAILLFLAGGPEFTFLGYTFGAR